MPGVCPHVASGLKAKRHALKGEALAKSDADYILKCLLYGDVYFQKNNKNLLYLYQVEKEKYLQITVRPNYIKKSRSSSLTMPTVLNIQFINEMQKQSKYSSANWELIK